MMLWVQLCMKSSVLAVVFGNLQAFAASISPAVPAVLFSALDTSVQTALGVFTACLQVVAAASAAEGHLIYLVVQY